MICLLLGIKLASSLVEGELIILSTIEFVKGQSENGNHFQGVCHFLNRRMRFFKTMQWCNPLTLELEQSGGVALIFGRTPPFYLHDKGSRTRLALSYFCDYSAWY